MYYELKNGGGLVLQTILHKFYSLAKDVRITRIWVSSEDSPDSKKTPPKPFNLGATDLPPLGNPKKKLTISDSIKPSL